MLVSRADWQAIAGDLGPGGMLRFRADAAEAIWSDQDTARFAAEVGVWERFLLSYPMM